VVAGYGPRRAENGNGAKEKARTGFPFECARGPYPDVTRAAAVVAAAAIAVTVRTLVAVTATRSPAPPRPTPSIALRPVRPSTPSDPAVIPPDAAPSRRAAAAVAEQFVEAMWHRTPGQAPLGWLDTVAGITDPGLVAQLRAARPTPDDLTTRASSVDVDGTYPDATDPLRVTVTCVARRLTATGLHDQPCADTVTMRATPDGRLLVVGVT
jgi:hypothetical protein